MYGKLFHHLLAREVFLLLKVLLKDPTPNLKVRATQAFLIQEDVTKEEILDI
jgi:hypothetical protein